jgi:hypothetical protein
MATNATRLTSAIQRAIKMVGRDNVYFVVFEENRFVLDIMEILPAENIITVATSSLPALCFSILRAIIRWRAIGIDAVIDLEFLTRFSAIFAFLSGAKSRVGFHTFFGEGPNRGNLMTHRLVYNSHLTPARCFMQWLTRLHATQAHYPLSTLGLQRPRHSRSFRRDQQKRRRLSTC